MGSSMDLKEYHINLGHRKNTFLEYFFNNSATVFIDWTNIIGWIHNDMRKEMAIEPSMWSCSLADCRTE